MSKEKQTSDKQKNGNDFMADVSSSALLSKARQMRLEQQIKIDRYTEHCNQYEIGTLNGIDRIVKLIERHSANGTQINTARRGWLEIEGNESVFNEYAKRNCLCKFDDGTECRYEDEHPFAEMTHFRCK